MRIPHKIKVMAWRACHNSLPTLQNLKLKRIEVEIICEMCKSEVEDLPHALIFCPKIWPYWEKHFPVAEVLHRDLNIIDLLSVLKEKTRAESIKLSFLFAWSF